MYGMSRRSIRLVALSASACIVALLASAAVHAADPPRYRAYYAIFDRGGALIPYHDSRWVPQGLTYWPEADALVISYYDAGHSNSGIAVVDRATGKRLKTLTLPDDGHVGGLAMTPSYLWVASSGKVDRYAKSALSSAPEGGTVVRDRSFTLKASSFITVTGSKMWVGRYEAHSNGAAYRYTIGPGETPRYDAVTFAIPSGVQGTAVASGKVVWSRSGGRDNDSTIEVRPLSAPTGPAGRRITAPNMSEGIVFAKGELHVVYESGAAKYADADYRVRTIHHGSAAKLLG
jgi:hypothetical protein